jgi:hypothetical protein
MTLFTSKNLSMMEALEDHFFESYFLVIVGFKFCT